MTKSPEEWLKNAIKQQQENSFFFKADENPFFTVQRGSLQGSASGIISGEGQIYTLTANTALKVAEQVFIEKNEFSMARYLKKQNNEYRFGNKQITVPVKDDSFTGKFKYMIPLYDCNEHAINTVKKNGVPLATMPNIKPFDAKKIENWKAEEHHISENFAILCEQNIRCRGLNKPFHPFLDEKAIKECVNYCIENPERCKNIWNEKYEKIKNENRQNSQIKDFSLKEKFFRKETKTENTKTNTTNKGRKI